ncbi:MAG TPA: glycosyltransferase [Candidatus Binataceae bacterium]|nr:glycosyltransferase [Candidatus Binataceae bacterium]
MVAKFPLLPRFEVAGGVGSPRVCIATWEIEGPSRNAGIGTSYASLTNALKRAGCEVTVLFLLGSNPTDGNIIDWINFYQTQKGIRLVPLPMPHEPRIHAAWAASVSYHAYVWLKEHQREFDVIHFPDCQGLGFYSMLAKRQGLTFADCTFVVTAHGPTFWVKEGSQDFIRNLGELEIDFMERQSVSSADIVVSPSQYLLGWMQDNGWTLPEQTYVAPNILRHDVLSENKTPRQATKVREIVFFGRLELRKGIKLFCDALDELCIGQGNTDFEVTFLGRETHLYGRSSIGYISDRSKRWSVPWHIVSNKYQSNAIEYLKVPGRVAVICSLSENSPNTVLECVGAGIPFLASNVGGIPEIIAPADREHVCFAPRPDILADRIRSILKEGAFSAHPSAPFADTERAWVHLHAGLANRPKSEQPVNSNRRPDEESIFPLVSVCFAYNVRENGRAATLASLKQQDYPHFEVILTECGSDASSPTSLSNEAQFDGKVLHQIRLRGSAIGAGRNAAAREAKGEYLLFVDDHTVLSRPNALSVLVQVAQRVGADIVTSTISFFLGSSDGSSEDRLEHSRRPFLGGDVATGAFVNCFGSTNALVRRDAFEEIRGFSDEAESTLDDWEFLSKAALMGLRIETIPDAYLWHREDHDQESLVHSLVNAVRSVKPYTTPGRRVAPSVEPLLFKVMQFGQGLKLERDANAGSPLSRGEQGPAVTG